MQLAGPSLYLLLGSAELVLQQSDLQDWRLVAVVTADISAVAVSRTAVAAAAVVDKTVVAVASDDTATAVAAVDKTVVSRGVKCKTSNAVKQNEIWN